MRGELGQIATLSACSASPRVPKCPSTGPPFAVRVRLYVARPSDGEPPEFPQVKALVVNAPHASIRADDQLHLGRLAHAPAHV